MHVHTVYVWMCVISIFTYIGCMWQYVSFRTFCAPPGDKMSGHARLRYLRQMASRAAVAPVSTHVRPYMLYCCKRHKPCASMEVLSLCKLLSDCTLSNLYQQCRATHTDIYTSILQIHTLLWYLQCTCGLLTSSLSTAMQHNSLLTLRD